MNSYPITEWRDFFVAVSGTAAAFAGLLFVGISINLARIINSPGIPARAGETLVFLGNVVVVALLALVPQPSRAFGIELLIAGVAAWTFVSYTDLHALHNRHYDTRSHGVRRLIFSQIATVPMLISAGFFLQRVDDGPYWLVPSLIFPLLVSMVNAWILLVEITR